MRTQCRLAFSLKRDCLCYLFGFLIPRDIAIEAVGVCHGAKQEQVEPDKLTTLSPSVLEHSSTQLCLVVDSAFLQERKSSAKIKFWSEISCRHPEPKAFSPSLERMKIKSFAQPSRPEGADVHDPRGSEKNIMQEKFELILSFPTARSWKLRKVC